MMSRTTRYHMILGLVGGAVIAGCTAIASATEPTLYAITEDGSLLTLDVEDGSIAASVAVSFDRVAGLDYSQSQLYSYTLNHANPSLTQSALYIVDPRDGSSVLIGELGMEFEFEGGLVLNGHGTAYAIGGRNVPEGAALFEIDLQTGEASELGSVGVLDINGLTLRGDGMLVGWSQFMNGVFTIDPDTFQTELLQNQGLIFGTRAQGGMAKIDDTYAYIFTNVSIVSGTAPDAHLFRVNMYTGDLEFIQSFDGSLDVRGLAFDPGCLAELIGDFVLNFYDISEFISRYSAGDLSVDFNDDGILNFFDLSIFIQSYSDGCS